MTVLTPRPSAACKAAFFLGLATSLFALQPAWAQEAAQEAASADDADAGEIVVTGSRVQRPGFVSPTPVTSFGVEEMEQKAVTNIADLVNDIPAFRGNITPTSTGLSTGNSGANYLNLRGLGANRTLILMDGKRMLPGFTSSNQVGVNINNVPAIALGRVDVVTGGASAAYGSDAVAGVVNLLFNRTFDGIKTDFQVGTSQRGDAERYRAAFIAGTSFGADGRGHMTFAAEWNRSEPAFQGDRGWGREGWHRYANPADTGRTDGIPATITRPDGRLANATYGGLIVSPSAAILRDIEFGPGGTVLQFDGGTERGPAFTTGGSGANPSQELTLAAKVERSAFLATLDYELTDRVTLFTDFLYGTSNGVVPMHPAQSLGNITIQRDNAFLPDSVRQLMIANNITDFRMGRLNRDMGFITGDVRSTAWRATVGAKVDLGNSWLIDAYAAYASDTTRTRVLNNQVVANFRAAVDSVLNAQGVPVCRSLATNPNCVPINLFGEGSPSPEAIAYVTSTGMFDSKGSQRVASVTLQGEPFSLWADTPIAIAVGGEYREEEGDSVVDEITEQTGYLVGNQKSFAGDLNVKEAFAEVIAPVISDVPFIKKFELNGAVRYTDYSVSGSVETWKGGAVWDISDDLRLRVTRSRDIRAPNLRELFGGSQLSNLNPIDPCDATRQTGNSALNCQALGIPATFRSTTANVQFLNGGGNPALTPEKADTLTIGVVASPAFLPGLQFSVDYYDIKIKDAIGTVSGPVMLEICYERNPTPGPTCSGIVRDANNQLTQIISGRFNIAQTRVKGYDFDLEYRRSFEGLGGRHATGKARALMSYVKDQLSSTDGAVFVQNAGDLVGTPKWKGNFSLSYDDGRFGLYPSVEFVGSAKIDNRLLPEDIDDNHVGAQWFVDLSTKYVLDGDGKFELYGGIENVFDNDPPRAPSSFFLPYYTNTTHYRLLGRYFYGGVRVKF